MMEHRGAKLVTPELQACCQFTFIDSVLIASTVFYFENVSRLPLGFLGAFIATKVSFLLLGNNLLKTKGTWKALAPDLKKV